MIIDALTITLYNDSDDLSIDDQFDVVLFPDSGNDIYPDNIEIPDNIQQKITEIRNLCFDVKSKI